MVTELLGGRYEVRLPAGLTHSSLLHSVQAGSGTQPVPYSISTWGSVPGSKTARAWGLTLTQPSAEVKKLSSYTSWFPRLTCQRTNGQLCLNLVPFPRRNCRSDEYVLGVVAVWPTGWFRVQRSGSIMWCTYQLFCTDCSRHLQGEYVRTKQPPPKKLTNWRNLTRKPTHIAAQEMHRWNRKVV